MDFRESSDFAWIKSHPYLVPQSQIHPTSCAASPAAFLFSENPQKTVDK